MQEKVLSKAAVPDLVKRLMGAAKVVAPVKRSGFHMLEPVSQPEEVALGCAIAYYSPKKYYMPPYEELLRFRRSDGKTSVQPVVDDEAVVLLGLHPCDINAILTYDAFFTKDNKDENYLRRRRQMTIIGVDCPKACDEFSFCYDMKCHEAKEGFDLLLTDIGDAYFVRVGTERGAQLVAKSQDPTPQQREALKKADQAKQAAFQKRIGYDTDELPKVLDQSYDSLIWTAAAKRCYSCGSCVLVCPTCFCFGVEDQLELNLAEGGRQRRWDGCMLAGFAEVAGGENFRKERSMRLRHRLFRKGKMIKEATGRPGCVGCGRCERACTAKISIVATYNQLKGGA